MVKKEYMAVYFRRAIFALIILLVSILQNTAGAFPEIFGIRAWLLIPFVVCLGMFERDFVGAILGVFAGLLWDMVSVSYCFNSIFLMAVGCMCGLMIVHLMRNNMVTALLLNGIAIFLYGLMHWLIFIAFKMDGSFSVFLKFYLPCMLYTFALSPLIYLLLRKIMKLLRTPE